MAFPFLTIFVTFVIFLAIRYRSIANRRAKRMNAYWNREAQANNAPAKDLSALPYLQIPEGLLPYGCLDDPDVTSIENAIQEIAKKPMLNLNGKDNAEIIKII